MRRTETTGPDGSAVLVILSLIGMYATFLPWMHTPTHGAILGTAGKGWMTFALFACILLRTLASVFSDRFELPALYVAGIAGGASMWAGSYFLEALALMEDVKLHPEGPQPVLGSGSYLAASVGLLIFIVSLLLPRGRTERLGRNISSSSWRLNA